MSIKLMTAVWEIPMPLADKMVLLALADNANDDGVCWPSMTTLCLKCGMEIRSVRRVIERLKTMGALTIKYRANRSNYFVLNKLWISRATPDRPSGGGGPRVRSRPDLGSPRTIIEPSLEPSSPMQAGVYHRSSSSLESQSDLKNRSQKERKDRFEKRLRKLIGSKKLQ
jgi:hypothetical protein